MRYLNKSLAIVLLLVVLCLSVITVGAVSVTSGADAKARMMQYAQQTYSVYKHYGFSDIHIAAVLANWQGESSMDPTSIESVFGEPYNINGPKHQAAIASNFDMNVYNPAAAMEVYHGNPPKPSGIGFAGYTAENATALIEYAKSFNKNWWDFDVQVAFSMDAKKGYASANWLQTTFKNTNYTDLATAVRAYVEEFERPKWLEAAVAERVPYAATWYYRIVYGADGFNTNDTTIKNSVVSMVGGTSVTNDNLDYAEPYDANGDKFLTIMDATDLQRSLAKFPDVDINLDVCDVDGNGHISVNDATMMQRIIAGMVDDSFD